MKQIGVSTTPVRFDEGGLPICPHFGHPYLSDNRAGARAKNIVANAGIDSLVTNQSALCVLEIGFGLGANFLAAAALHERLHGQSGRWLNYVAVEMCPMNREDLIRSWQACNVRRGNERLAELLLAQWPPLMHGIHRISLPSRIELTLSFGDAAIVLADVHCAADCVIHDAYSPTINPSMWSDGFIRTLAARSKPDARLVCPYRDSNARARFSRAGYAEFQEDSNHLLTARYQPPFHASRLPGLQPARSWSNKTAIVVGAGLAGMQCARELARTGWQVSVIDKQSGLSAAPQQQPAVAAHPHFSVDDNPLARLTRAAYLLSRNDRQTLQPIGRLMLMGNAQLDALTPLLTDCPGSFAQPVSSSQASEIAGTPLNHDALWLPEMPIRLSDAQAPPAAAAAAVGIQWLSPQELSNIQYRDGLWRCLDENQQLIGSASVVVLATGHLPSALQANLWPGTLVHQGQSTSIQSNAITLRCVIGGASYACPLPGVHQILAGATTVDAITEQDLKTNDQRNQEKLAELLGHDPDSFTVLNRHLGQRSATRDHLPMIGPMPDLSGIAASADRLSENDRLPLPVQPGLYLATGFGGRGLLWSYLAARCITDHVNNLTAVLPTPLEQAIAPNRFIRRALRQGQIRLPSVAPPAR